MRKMLACIVCFGLCAVLASAGAGKGGLKVEGAWTITGLTHDGKKLDAEILEKIMATFTMKEGKYTTTVMGKQDEAGTYTIDAKKKPAHIDLMITEGKDKGKTQLGLLKLDGDVLTLTFAKAGSKDRPKDFEGADGNLVATLKRGK